MATAKTKKAAFFSRIRLPASTSRAAAATMPFILVLSRNTPAAAACQGMLDTVLGQCYTCRHMALHTLDRFTERRTAVYTLAAVGFISLVAAGMALAVYSSRYLPAAADRVAGAAAYIGSLFTPAEKPSLAVVPTASTTIPFGPATSTPATSTPETPIPPAPSAGKESTATVAVGGAAAATPALHGLPDLAVTITGVGYLATTSATSFVASSTVPHGSRPAVRFTIKNIGTNSITHWRFSASIPTQTAYTYISLYQQTLNPGDSIDYTLGFDQATGGTDKVITINANFEHAVAETTLDNNVASTTVTVLGS